MEIKEQSARKAGRLTEESGRITPREAIEAFERTGLIPAQDSYLNNDTACPIGVLMFEAGHFPAQDALSESETIDDWLAERLGVFGRSYGMGFIYGFDNDGEPHPLSNYDEVTLDAYMAEKTGYRDGCRVRRFVFKDDRNG